MNRGTVIRFGGTLAEQFAELLKGSGDMLARAQQLSQGDLRIAVNDCSRIFLSICVVIDEIKKKKNRDQLARNEEEQLEYARTETERQKQETQAQILKQQKELFEEYQRECEKLKEVVKTEASNALTEKIYAQNLASEAAKGLRKLLRRALSENAQALRSLPLTEGERRRLEEQFRLLQNEYNKLIKI